MRYYPIFLDLENRTVVFSGAGEHAAAKIRLLLKTSAHIRVVGQTPCETVRRWADERRIELIEREIEWQDVADARLVYGANDDLAKDRHAVEIGRWAGAITNIVDNLEESEFLTPALVDRDPVTVAIGTEGTAPVLARKIKSEVEESLPQATGLLARLADSFRPIAASLGDSKKRRAFWATYFFERGPQALASGGRKAVGQALEDLFIEARANHDRTGSVVLCGTGPGDPELLTLKARKALHSADVILHDQLVPSEILELARREAQLIPVGKTGFGPSTSQADINALMIEKARAGHEVLRLKGGDTAIFARLDEEIDALDAAAIDWSVIPGITAASAAAASVGVSLTRRGRNSNLRVITGHDVDGFAEHDWRELAKPGASAAIYMGLKAARFIRGRLLMHGADAQTPVTVVANASRIDEITLFTTLIDLPEALKAHDINAPAVLLFGIAPRRSKEVFGGLQTAQNAITDPTTRTTDAPAKQRLQA